jgi:hypothetical protein
VFDTQGTLFDVYSAARGARLDQSVNRSYQLVLDILQTDLSAAEGWILFRFRLFLAFGVCVICVPTRFLGQS